MTHYASSTIASLVESTTDDDEHDDDEAIPEHERKDEINDSKTKCQKIFSPAKKNLLTTRKLKCLFLIPRRRRRSSLKLFSVSTFA